MLPVDKCRKVSIVDVFIPPFRIGRTALYSESESAPLPSNDSSWDS